MWSGLVRSAEITTPSQKIQPLSYSLMLVARFKADGRVDVNGSGYPLFLQKYSLDPDFLDWYASGVLPESATSCIVYGDARAVRVSSVILSDGRSSTSRIMLPSAPAIF